MYPQTPSQSMQANNTAGTSRPSSRPTPVRSLRQPHALNVAHRDAYGRLAPESQGSSDAAAYKAALTRKLELRKKGDQWADRMSEGVVSDAELRKGARYLELHHFTELTHERHLSMLCSYPLCGKPSRAKWKPTQSLKISIRKASIESTDGNGHDGYCSRLCEERGGHVAKQLAEGVAYRSKGWRIELLDDVMKRLEKGKGDGLGGQIADGYHGAGRGARAADLQQEPNGALATAERGDSAVNGDSSQSDAGGDVLRIVERPTTSNPTAPSKSPINPNTRLTDRIPDAAPAEIRSTTSPFPSATRLPIANRRDYALVAPTTLTTSILAASRVGTVGARIAQAEQAGESDDSDNDADGVSETGRTGNGSTGNGRTRVPAWVKEMSFGPEDETDDMRDLFEQMRFAREIMESEDASMDGP